MRSVSIQNFGMDQPLGWPRRVAPGYDTPSALSVHHVLLLTGGFVLVLIGACGGCFHSQVFDLQGSLPVKCRIGSERYFFGVACCVEERFTELLSLSPRSFVPTVGCLAHRAGLHAEPKLRTTRHGASLEEGLHFFYRSTLFSLSCKVSRHFYEIDLAGSEGFEGTKVAGVKPQNTFSSVPFATV